MSSHFISPVLLLYTRLLSSGAGVKMQSYMTAVFSHTRVTCAPVVYPVTHMNEKTEIIMITSRVESCTESLTTNSFIHPPFRSVSKNSTNENGAGSEETIGVVTSCASSPPLTAHLSKGYAPHCSFGKAEVAKSFVMYVGFCYATFGGSFAC